MKQQHPEMDEKARSVLNIDNIPQELRKEGLFCLWRYEDRNGKPSKVPYNPHDGKRAKSNDAGTFRDFRTVSSGWIRATSAAFAGIGLGIFGRVGAIDIDNCVDAVGNVSSLAADVIRRLDSYTEISPSGTGIRIIFFVDGFTYDKARYYIKRKGLELYIAGMTKRFVTITGNVYGEKKHVVDGTGQLQGILDAYMKRSEKPDTERPPALEDQDRPRLSDDEIISRAGIALNGDMFGKLWSGDIRNYGSQSEADLALCNILAFWTGRDPEQMDRLYRQSGLMRDKWDRQQSGTTYGAITIQRAIQDCKEIYSPDKASGKVGRPAKSPITVEVIDGILRAMGVEVRLNVISGEIEFIDFDEKYSRENLPTTAPMLILDRIKLLSKFYQKPNESEIRAYIEVIADIRRYNPVRDMLEGTFRTDKVNRIQELYEILGITENITAQIYVRKWLHQCVAMALNDERRPYAADGCLTLQGAQGCGKTSFFRALAICPEWFNEGVSLDMGNKDTVIPAVSKWICELGELDGTLKREQTSLKAFLTQQIDNHRKPYGRAWIKRPRRTSFCATVNDETFLRDTSGSRRFWVVHVDHIDLDRLRTLNPDWFKKLWVQVYEDLYKTDPQGFRLTSEEQEVLQSDNLNQFTVISRDFENILETMDFSAPLTRWRRLTTKEIKQQYFITWVTASQIGRILTQAMQIDPRIEHTRPQNKSTYLVPPPKTGGAQDIKGLLPALTTKEDQPVSG